MPDTVKYNVHIYFCLTGLQCYITDLQEGVKPSQYSGEHQTAYLDPASR